MDLGENEQVLDNKIKIKKNEKSTKIIFEFMENIESVNDEDLINDIPQTIKQESSIYIK